MPNMKKKVKVNVLQRDIDEGECRKPHKCAIKLSVARAIDVPHGYIKVDATGISVTRRTDFREKAFLPNSVKVYMVKFDKKLPVKPFTFTAVFHKTSKVYKSTAARRAQVNANRNRRLSEGHKPPKYNLHQRVIGLSVPKDLAA